MTTIALEVLKSLVACLYSRGAGGDVAMELIEELDLSAFVIDLDRIDLEGVERHVVSPVTGYCEKCRF